MPPGISLKRKWMGSRQSVQWINAFTPQQFPHGDGISPVEAQCLNRRPPGRGASNQHRAVPVEMICPPLPARVEQQFDSLGLRVNARQVWPFEAITERTGQREIFQLGWAAVLLGDDMIQMKRDFREQLWEVAILAAMPGPIADGLLGGVIHETRSGGGPE